MYVREEGVVGLAFAVSSMTTLPAQVFRIPDRGLVRVGKAADIAVFDPARVQDLATFTEPHQLSQGMSYVFVNGRAAVWEGECTGVLAGQALRKR